MRILIDECIDERFRNSLTGHDSQTARYAGLGGWPHLNAEQAGTDGKVSLL